MPIKKVILVMFLFVPFSGWADSLGDAQLSCLLEPSRHVKISSQVSGVVKEIMSERGDKVKQGQLLLSLEDAVARAALASSKTRSEYAEIQLERSKKMSTKGYLSDANHDELVFNKKLAQQAVEEAKVMLKQRKIYSPIQGVIVGRNISVGEYIRTEHVLELVGLDPLYAEIVLQANQYGVVKTGMKVALQVIGLPDAPYVGVITIVDPVIDAASGTFGIRVEMPNPGEKIPAGLNCRAYIASENADAHSLPEQAAQY